MRISLSVRTQRKRRAPVQALTGPEETVKSQVPPNRQDEIRRYLELYGYKPDRSILQVHISGYFGRGTRRPKEVAGRERAAARYGGRTFTVLGRTHDPDFPKRLITPKKKPEDANPGYVGYLFKEKDEERKLPHELLPLDFTPASLDYPRDWREMFATRGYLVTMHVPSDFARKKNELTRRLRRIKGDVDVKKEWKFLDELQQYGYNATSSSTSPT